VDGDGVADAEDNCAMTPNEDQRDVDDDGRGDACDEDDATDEDADGVSAVDDNCPDVANEDQLDADQDGIGDACDACPDVGIGEVGVGEDGCPVTNDEDGEAAASLGEAGDCACDTAAAPRSGWRRYLPLLGIRR
jgi:hypothetical protein